jgi:hypothetical protein
MSENIQDPQNVSVEGTSTPDIMGAFETSPKPTTGSPSSPSKPQTEPVSRLQSERDKYFNDVQVLTKTVDQYRTVVNAFELLQNDPEYRRAWLAEVDPEVFDRGSVDVDAEVQKVLTKEFPDFSPSREDKDTPGTKSYRYYRRADKLYEQFENKKPVEVKGLKEVLESRKAENTKKAQKLQADIERIKTERGWNDPTIKRMKDWIQGLSVYDYAKMFNFAMSRIDPTLVTNPTEIRGDSAAGNLSEQVSQMLGPRKSGPRQ